MHLPLANDRVRVYRQSWLRRPASMMWVLVLLCFPNLGHAKGRSDETPAAPTPSQPDIVPEGMLRAVWRWSRRLLAVGVAAFAAVAVMSTIPGYLVYFAVQPLPPPLVLKQVIFGTLAMLLLGLLLAWLSPARKTL